MQTFLYKKATYKSIFKLLSNHVSWFGFNELIKSDDLIIKKFAMVIVKDMVWLGDNIIPLIDELETMENKEGRKFKKKAKFLYELMGYFTSIYGVLYELINNSNEFEKVIGRPEIVPNLALVLNLSLKWITEYFDTGFNYAKIETNKEIDFNEFKIQTRILLRMFKDNKTFLETFVNDVKVFDLDRIKLINIDGLLDSITKYIDSNKEDVVYPEEFLDPIMYSKINEPMILPGMEDVFMEKSVIEQILLTEEKNPFTRDKLTVDQLEKFNARPEISSKLKDFKKRMKEWLKNKDTN